ncbi:RsmE family RNA methyltransferase [Rubripirellula reticaptiva]|uniref:Ribosomal RNA small subunit methyltransferase E n=1 Tax=Rubripirellula reticaptiva TaxID=2528013 RepID=A0A5C6EUB7_9BACT|nr:RsmE family RNA methyltransferase [Rubripirellula reticaptiva]TWU51984.1 16S ribosomal RNA methyltransferase RsmE [Rubripirellula reticaptiva]
MNIVLFTEEERVHGVDPDDHRVTHVRRVLSIHDGQYFDAGVINGMRGKAKFGVETGGRLPVEFDTMEPAGGLYPVDVVVGISRPQTCRFVLRSLASLGVRSIEFVLTESGERSYASSQLWSSGEYQEIVTSAVSQAFETSLPAVRFDRTLAQTIADEPVTARPPISRICLDNYEATCSLSSAIDPGNHATCLLVGSERGWSDRERNLIREQGFVMASIGGRVLRVETAVVAAVSTLLALTCWPCEKGTLSTRQ